MNRSMIIVGVTLIRQKAIAAIHTIRSYETVMALINFGGRMKTSQATKCDWI